MLQEGVLLKETRDFAEGMLTNDLPKQYIYHSLSHTQSVVDAVLDIGRNSQLSDEDLETVEVAAWFHDLGYTVSKDEHEDRSIEIARGFLAGRNVASEKIDQIAGCIQATKMPQSPKNILEEVICDADLIHLATDQYCDLAIRLKTEMEFTKNLVLTEKEWMGMNADFLSEQQYFTPYAQEKYSKGKLDNLEFVRSCLMEPKKKKKGKKGKGGKEKKELQKTIDKLQIKLDAFKSNTPTRGIETMFRLTSKNHLELSAMADNKANIMISINSIILSILVSVLYRKLEEYPHMIVPTLIMTVVCLVTIVFAILATRPNISKGMFTHDDIVNKKTNLLFFGNFHGMKLSEYEWGMTEMMKDANYLYGSLIKDIYFLGKVLGAKYKLLRIAYTIFMFGFVLAVMSFILAEIFLKSEYPY